MKKSYETAVIRFELLRIPSMKSNIVSQSNLKVQNIQVTVSKRAEIKVTWFKVKPLCSVIFFFLLQGDTLGNPTVSDDFNLYSPLRSKKSCQGGGFSRKFSEYFLHADGLLGNGLEHRHCPTLLQMSLICSSQEVPKLMEALMKNGDIQPSMDTSVPGGGGYLNQFCWVCAAGLSDLLANYGLSCGQLQTPSQSLLGKYVIFAFSTQSPSTLSILKYVILKHELTYFSPTVQTCWYVY